MTTLTTFDDTTVRMPWTPLGTEDIVVRPVLGILYRLALGAMAGAWVPRFLRYERNGRAAIRLHLPALVFPAMWAFYRKLWVTGGIMAALPFGLAALLVLMDHALADSPGMWLVCAIALVWGLPAMVAALAADSLLYRRVKLEVRAAEAASERTDVVADLLRARRHTAPDAAFAIGGAMLLLLSLVTVPELSVFHEQRVVRANVAASIAAAAPLQRQVEAHWNLTGSIPRRPDYEVVESERGAMFLDTINVSPANGRVRIALGATAGAVAGKTLLLAPSVDEEQNIHWQCIAIDVPAQYLPQDCRGT